MKSLMQTPRSSSKSQLSVSSQKGQNVITKYFKTKTLDDDCIIISETPSPLSNKTLKRERSESKESPPRKKANFASLQVSAEVVIISDSDSDAELKPVVDVISNSKRFNEKNCVDVITIPDEDVTKARYSTVKNLTNKTRKELFGQPTETVESFAPECKPCINTLFIDDITNNNMTNVGIKEKHSERIILGKSNVTNQGQKERNIWEDCVETFSSTTSVIGENDKSIIARLSDRSPTTYLSPTGKEFEQDSYFGFTMPDDICNQSAFPFESDSDEDSELPQFINNCDPPPKKLKCNPVNKISGSGSDVSSCKDLLKLDANDSFTSSQESICSLGPVLQKLKHVTDANIPLTPRHPHKHLLNLEGSPNSEGFSDCDAPMPKKPKVKLTLNRLVRDQRNSKELRNIEDKLLSDVQSGGFSRYLEDLSDNDEDLNENHDLEDQDLAIMKIISRSTDDCLSLPKTHSDHTVFNPCTYYKFYCEHTVMHGQHKTKNFSSLLDLLRSGKINEVVSIQSAEENQNLLRVLIKVLISSTDSTIQSLSLNAFLKLMKRHRKNVDIFSVLDEAIDNLGILPQFFTPNHKPTLTKRFICKSCKCRKFSATRFWKQMHFVFKFLRSIPLQHEEGWKNQQLIPYIILSCHLLASKPPKLVLYEMQRCIDALLDKLESWPETRVNLASEVTKQVSDLTILEAIVSYMPPSSERTMQLKRHIALSGLRRTFGGNESDDLPPIDPLDSRGLSTLASLCEDLSLITVQDHVTRHKPGASIREVYHSILSSVTLVQVCVGNKPVSNQFRSQLQSISISVRRLGVAIRDNGALYASELKNYIRILDSKMEMQLNEMPKSKYGQQNIFKYLDSTRVVEHIVIDDDINISNESHVEADDAEPTNPELCDVTNKGLNNQNPIACEGESPKLNGKEDLALVANDNDYDDDDKMMMEFASNLPIFSH